MSFVTYNVQLDTRQNKKNKTIQKRKKENNTKKKKLQINNVFVIKLINFTYIIQRNTRCFLRFNVLFLTFLYLINLLLLRGKKFILNIN